MKNRFLRIMFCFLLAGFFIQGINISYSYAKTQEITTKQAEVKKQKENQATIIKSNEDNNNKIVINTNLKEQILIELRKRHAKGEYLEISENLIKSLSEEELRNLLFTDSQTLSALKIGVDLFELINTKGQTNLETEENFNEEEFNELIGEAFNKNYKDVDFNNLYSFPEETQKNLFDTIKDYVKEKKEAMTILALGGITGIGLLKKGYDLLKSEPINDKIKRHLRLEKAIQEVILTEEKIQTDYKEDISPNFNNDDNLRNLTENALYCGMTLKQEKQIAQDTKKIANVSIKMMEIVNEKLKRNNIKEDLIQDSEIQEEKKEVAKIKGSKNIEERLVALNKIIEDTME